MIYASSSLIVGFGTEMISRCGNLVEVDHLIEKILSKSRVLVFLAESIH